MDSEAVLADHQTTDGIVEEKQTVPEKHSNGEESKDEEIAAIAEAERFHADREEVLRESVIYCSKMPSSTSEKECRKEEVDFFSEIVEVSPKEEATNKNKNGELEVPLETAEVEAANAEVEPPPVEVDSNNANSAARDAEEISEQVIAVETREIEAKLEDQKVPTDSVSAKFTDDIEVVANEVEKKVPITPVVDSSSTEIAEESREVEAEVKQQVSSDSSIAISDVEKQVLNESSNAASATSIAEEAREAEVETEVEQQFPSDSTNPAEAIGVAEKSGEIGPELADDNQEVTTEAQKHVATETSDVHADEVGIAEAKVIEDENEAETEVQEQVPSDRISDETHKLEPKFVDEEAVVRAEAEKQIPIEESTEIGAEVEDDEKEAATEVQEQVPIDSDTFTSANRIAQETKRLESKLMDDDQEVLEEAKKQISSEESSDVGAKIDDGKTEVEPGVEQVVPSDSGSPTSVTLVAERSGEIEAEFVDDNKEVKTEAEKQVATETNDVTADEVRNTEAKIDDDEKEDPMEAQEQVPSVVSSTSTSADRIAEETKRLGPELIDEDKAVPIEAEKQIPVEELTEIGARVEDGNTELESEVEQQFHSDFGCQTSAIGITERSREIEAELADVNGEVLREVEKPVATEPNDSTSTISTSDEFRETNAKIESDEEGAVTEVGEQISTDYSPSANRTDEVKLADDNQEAVVNAEEQVLIESSRDISVVAGAEGNKEIDVELKGNKQEEEEEAEIRKQELNQGNEADAADDNGRVLAEDEMETATVDGASNNSNVTELKTINLVQEDAGTDHTKVVQTASEISQPEVEVENEKPDSLTQIEELSVAETNKIDSGSFAELPTREEKTNVSAESLEKNDNILEEKTFMDNINDVNTISQVPHSNVKEAKGPINNSQTDAKDIDIEILKEDKITLVESSKNLDCSTETNDEFEGKKSSEGIEIAEGEKEDILKVGKVILDEDSKHSYAPDITESSNKIEKLEVAKEKCQDSENNSTIADETTQSTCENADALSNLSVENKTSEDKEEKESKDESVNREYVEAPKDIDVKEEVATAAFVDAENKKESESLSPKSADLVKLEEVPKESALAKSSARRSNNIISKVKHQIVKAKKAIMGKSPSSKAMSPKNKEEVK